MPKPKVEWMPKSNSKEEDKVKISHPSFGVCEIIARHFHNISLKGTKLLRENGHGTFVDDPDAYSIYIRHCRDPKEFYIVSIYFYEHDIITIYCDSITKYASNYFSFNMRGEGICSVITNNVKISEEVERELSEKGLSVMDYPKKG